MSLAFFCALFSSAPLTDQGYRWHLSAIRCCVADVTAFIVTMIYWFRMTTATGKNTSKRPGAGEGELLNANSSDNFHPFPLRTVHFASGYCLAICCISSLFDYAAKQIRSLCQMAPASFCPSNLTLLVRWSTNSIEEGEWQRFFSTGNQQFFKFSITLSPAIFFT